MSIVYEIAGFVDDRNVNVGELHTRGIDAGASYTHRLGRLGSAKLDFVSSWSPTFFIAPGGLAPTFDCAGAYGQLCGFALPKWRHNLRGTWAMPDSLSLSVLWRHIGPVSVDAADAQRVAGVVYNPAAARIAAQDYLDATITYRVADRYSLRFGVRNFLDREPPIISAGQFGACAAPLCNGNTFPQLYDPLGRFVFAGVSMDLKPF